MTTSGKILVGIIIIAGIAGLLLMAKAADVHSEAIDQYEQARSSMEAEQATLAKNEAEISRVNANYDQLIQRWYQKWDDVNTVSNGDGSISIDAGSEQGIPAPEGNVPVVLYGFRPDPENPDGSVFVKRFRVTDVQAKRATLTAEGYTTEEEIAAWQPGNWRFWKFVPSAYSNTLTKLDARRAETDFLLEKQERAVAQQEELLTHAKKMLDNRHLELNGNPELENNQSLPIEIRLGLIKAIEETQNQHLTVLQEVDQLRRDIKETTDEINALLDENKELAARLPQ